ncbi:phosphatidylserine synthase 1-like isoform X1 [Pocillopora verrucosa]|uniref:phosphatidylserine synthase 1-like isoform X1 n=1 Tax=Pocillopora verrucosa TaxID=203993 RepID=UPI0027972E99|nr:phosphatidylserine synthase 1-like isoform X1 [Pocillopora verrucosa]
MADDRSPRRRKRTFSTTSTISTDDYQDASEQIVEDISLEFFYKPRSITALACLFVYLVYSAFTRNPDATREENIWSGMVSLAVVFLVLSLLVMPNGPFIRPHPALWRMIFGASVLYMSFLAFALFQTRADFRNILFFFDPELRHEGPDTKEYAVNCSQVSLARLWGHCDIFAFAHFFGWALKALLIRNAWLLWIASITWEVTEVFFSHLLPNFAECWWDALLLDFLICNGLGIHFGLYVCKKLEMRNYHWESIKDIQTTTGKLRRAAMQFTPASWTHVRWMDPKCSYMRFFAIYQLLIISQIVELNTFFLKHILWVPTSHWLNYFRLFVISLTVAPSLRQYYVYITDTRSRRLGTQAWVLIVITCLELLICIKYGLDMFKKAEIVSITLWLLFQMAISLMVLYFMVMTKSKEVNVMKANIVERLKMLKKYGTKKPTFLEEIPAEDPNTKTLNYIKKNGNHTFQEDGQVYDFGLANGGYQNGTVVRGEQQHYERGLRSTKHIHETPPDDKPTADPSHVQAQGTRKRRPRRSDLGGQLGGVNYEVKTRLRTRKSQAGL